MNSTLDIPIEKERDMNVGKVIVEQKKLIRANKVLMNRVRMN
jgi:hypothetical protein